MQKLGEAVTSAQGPDTWTCWAPGQWEGKSEDRRGHCLSVKANHLNTVLVPTANLKAPVACGWKPCHKGHVGKRGWGAQSIPSRQGPSSPAAGPECTEGRGSWGASWRSPSHRSFSPTGGAPKRSTIRMNPGFGAEACSSIEGVRRAAPQGQRLHHDRGSDPGTPVPGGPPGTTQEPACGGPGCGPESQPTEASLPRDGRFRS